MLFSFDVNWEESMNTVFIKKKKKNGGDGTKSKTVVMDGYALNPHTLGKTFISLFLVSPILQAIYNTNYSFKTLGIPAHLICKFKKKGSTSFLYVPEMEHRFT